MSETTTASSAKDAVLDQLFRAARTHNAWQERPVEEATLRAVWELTRWGPTSANCSPARIVFCRSREAKARLRPFLSPGNVEKTMAAPVCAILAYDTAFYEKLDDLFPQNPAMRDYFARDPEQSERHALRNASLQGGYFILAARALGLDCGPMSGFDPAGVDREFFPDGRWKSNFLCNLGYGDPAGLRPRNPRLAFDDACRIL